MLGVLLVVNRHGADDSRPASEPDAVRQPRARMTRRDERHKALVTAPFRGEGWDTLNALADVVYDPWIEHVPLRLMNGEKLAARLVEEGADILIVESDSVKGPVFDLPLKLHRLVPRRPQQRRHRGRDQGRASRCCARPAATPTRSPRSRSRCMFAVNRFVVPADRDVRADQVYAGGKIPYQRYRAWQLAGRTVGHRRPRRGRARREVALRGPRACACCRSTRTTPRRRTTRRRARRRCSPSATSCRCTRWSRPRPSGSWARRSSRR